MRKTIVPAAVLAFILAMASTSFAITWFPEEFTCPVDGQKNTFMVIGSYGSYIYSYPSKYQWLFFPVTDSPAFYICKKCHLATYMWDFDKLPKEKIPELKKILASVKVSKSFDKYTDLSIAERLEIMEKVYAALGKDDQWWEQFNRIKGYHYGKAGEVTKAAEARRKSLSLLTKKLSEPKATPKKLLYYMSAAMKHFLEDDAGALADLQRALETKYENAIESADDQKSAEEGLNQRITDFIDRIKSEKDKPRFFDKFSTTEH
ncbi:MAG: hypothetical protein WBO10_09665 [Pyrinomonadaceae bacterium]